MSYQVVLSKTLLLPEPGSPTHGSSARPGNPARHSVGGPRSRCPAAAGFSLSALAGPAIQPPLLLRREYSEDQRASRWPHAGAGPWEELLREGAPPLTLSPLGALGAPEPAAGSGKNGSDTRATEVGQRDCVAPGEDCALPSGGPTAGCPCGWALGQEVGSRDRDVHLEGRGPPPPTWKPGAAGEVPNRGGCRHVAPGRAPQRGHPSRDNPVHMAQEELRGRRCLPIPGSANCPQAGAACMSEGSSEGQGSLPELLDSSRLPSVCVSSS